MRKLFSREAKALKELVNTHKRVLIIADTDVDGITSASMLSRWLEDTGKEHSVVFIDRDQLNDVVKRVDRNTLPVIMDIRITKDHSIPEKTVVIDHHEPEKYTGFHINPWLKKDVLNVEPYRVNTSMIVYYLTGRENDDYLAVIGNVADKGDGPHSEGLRKKVFQKYGKEVIEQAIKNIGVLEHTDEVTPEDVHNVVKYSTSPKDIAFNNRLKQLSDKISNEIEKHLRGAGEDEDIIIYKVIESPFKKIKSPVSTILASRFPEKVVVIGQKEGNVINYSLRFSSAERYGVHMGNIAKEAASLFGGKGGGHPPAAGLKVPAEKEEAFRNWIIRRIKELIRP